MEFMKALWHTFAQADSALVPSLLAEGCLIHEEEPVGGLWPPFPYWYPSPEQRVRTRVSVKNGKMVEPERPLSS